jgi:hypothetical protein
MKQLLSWTLDTIRKEDASFSWMEEHRFDWSPLVKNAISQSIEGKTVLVITDDERKWFESYILTNINDLKKGRPLLPFYSLKSCFPQISSIKTTHDIDLLEDMLDISYPQGYYIWYIGKGDHVHKKLCDRGDDNFLWVMDDDIADALTLRASDPLLDIKLLQLYRLFDNTLLAALFGDLDLEA